MRRSFIVAGVAALAGTMGIIGGPAHAAGQYHIKVGHSGTTDSSVDVSLSQHCNIDQIPSGLNGLDALAVRSDGWANHTIKVSWTTQATIPSGQGMGQVWSYDATCKWVNLPRRGTGPYTIPVPGNTRILVFHGDAAVTIDFDVAIVA